MRTKNAAFFRAYVTLTVVKIGLRLFPFRLVYRYGRALAVRCRTGTVLLSKSDVDLTTRMVNSSAGRSLSETNCLPRALTSYFLLLADGSDPEFIVGVAPDGARKLKAHAWIELCGKVIMGDLPDLSDYRRLPSLERANL